jgi:hypothetical protein
MEQRPVFHSRTPGSISGGRKARLYNRANRRLEFKRAVRRASKVNNAHVFEAVVSRSSALHRKRSGTLPKRTRTNDCTFLQPLANHLWQSTLFTVVVAFLALLLYETTGLKSGTGFG